MANWSSDEIVIILDRSYHDHVIAEKSFKDFLLILHTWLAQASLMDPEPNAVSWSALWDVIIDNLTKIQPLKTEMVDTYKNDINKTTNSYFTPENITISEDKIIFEEVSSRWALNDIPFKKILEDYFPGLKMYYCCTELGEEVFVNTDTSRCLLSENTYISLNLLVSNKGIIDALRKEKKAFKKAFKEGDESIEAMVEDWREEYSDAIDGCFDRGYYISDYCPVESKTGFYHDLEITSGMTVCDFTEDTKTAIENYIRRDKVRDDQYELSSCISQYDNLYQEIVKVVRDELKYPYLDKLENFVQDILLDGEYFFYLYYYTD